ncbi:MAG: hypothetical protein KGJ87_10075 [Planctomycetota bacterium]|nr:hypothetical protein [Planctomycetota bacterium]MDE1889464.1 hypothetical protein [Planctomycetota bacterium]MDE2217489.1 hypothetical protein [Planctomycetota bacterium]
MKKVIDNFTTWKFRNYDSFPLSFLQKQESMQEKLDSRLHGNDSDQSKYDFYNAVAEGIQT